MGLFQLQIALTAGGKAVYKNKEDQYLYYWPDFSNWRISANYTTSKAGVTSTSATDTVCPQQSSGWQEYANKVWGGSIDVEAGLIYTDIQSANTCFLKNMPSATNNQKLRHTHTYSYTLTYTHTPLHIRIQMHKHIKTESKIQIITRTINISLLTYTHNIYTSTQMHGHHPQYHVAVPPTLQHRSDTRSSPC